MIMAPDQVTRLMIYGWVAMGIMWLFILGLILRLRKSHNELKALTDEVREESYLGTQIKALQCELGALRQEITIISKTQ